MFDIARWRARFPWLDTVMKVQERFSVIGGGALSASIGLAGFLSLFPLLLLGISVIGYVSSGNTDFVKDIVEELQLEGRSAEVVTNAIEAAEGSRRTASVVGLVGLLWSGLGVVGSLQAAFNSAWQTTGRGLLDRAVSLGWLVGAGILFIASASLGPLLNLVPGPVMIATVTVGVAINTGLMIWTYSFLGNQPVPWRGHLWGAVLVAFGFEILKFVGSVYVPRAVASSSALYGTLGVVFAVLAWFLLYARVVVYGAVVNVLRWEKEQGTVTVEIEVPRMNHDVPLTADRGGAITESAEAPSGAAASE